MIETIEDGGASEQALDRFFVFSVELHKSGGRAQEAFRSFQHADCFRIERPAVYRSQRQKRRSAVSSLFQIFDRLLGVFLRLGHNVLVCLTKRRFNCGFIFCRDAQNLRYGAANASSKVRIRFTQRQNLLNAVGVSLVICLHFPDCFEARRISLKTRG